MSYMQVIKQTMKLKNEIIKSQNLPIAQLSAGGFYWVSLTDTECDGRIDFC